MNDMSSRRLSSRRDFLRVVGLGGLSMAALPALNACGVGTGGGSSGAAKNGAADVTGSFDWKKAKGQKIKILQTPHPYQQSFQPLLKEFTAKTGIEVTADLVPEADYFTKLNTELAGKSGEHDVFMTGAYFIWQYGPPGWMEDLKPWLQNDSATSQEYAFDDIYEGLRTATSWDFKPGSPLGTGGQWAIPWGFETNVVAYNKKLFDSKGWKLPTTWADFTTLCDTIKAAGITPFGYAGANASYYMVRALLTSAAKIGTEQCLIDIDNLKAGAWTADPIKKAAQAWGEIGNKYINKTFLGLKHTEVQLQQDQDKLAFYPCGSWLENEQAKDTPPTFEYAVTPLPSVTTSDQLPATAINAAAGEIYFAAAKGKNPQGGKEYIRGMLSKEAALGFTKLTKSLTVVAGAADGQTISPGLTSANDMLGKAGKDVFVGYLFDNWYKKLDDESRAAVNDLMFKGGDANKFCQRMEAASQAVAKDSSVTKFTRS